MSVEATLKEKGIVIPEGPAPAGSYVPVVVLESQKLAYTAGQLPKVGSEILHKGKLGKEITVQQGAEAAKICALNALAVLRTALGSLDKIKRIVKVVGFVASAEGFTQQPSVMNGASDFLVEVFGEAGKHARSAVGVAELPLGASVEVELIVELH